MASMDSPPSRYRPRPSRLERLFANIAPVYFVTFNTYCHRNILARVEIHTAFSDFCRKAEHFHIAVGRYVLMPDHVHLFVAMPEVGDLSLSDWVKALKTVMGKKLLTLGVEKPHWQEGFFDHVLRSEESHAQKWEYVRMNPVRAGLCREPEKWLYQGEVAAL